MTNLRKVADEYLAVRRRLGFALVDAGRLLPDFVAFLEQRGVEHISTELALEWAARPSDAQPAWRRFRLGVVRGFAEYVRHTDPATQVPPPNLLPSNYRRVAPYLYSEHEIAAMMAAARLLAPPLRAATYETLIGLIAVTGMRIGEAIGLDRDDIDEQTRLLTVRDGKRGGRQVPLARNHIARARRLRARARSAVPAACLDEFAGLHPRNTVVPVLDLRHLSGTAPPRRNRRRPATPATGA